MEPEAPTDRHAPPSFASQFETFSGIQQWRSWLYILVGLCLLIFVCALFDVRLIGQISLLDIALYGTLLSLALGTMYLSYKDAFFIDQQTKVASKQVDLLLELNDVSDFLEQADTSIFRNHIESLHNIFLASPEISQDNLIEILHSRLLARNKIVELFSSILITLGLIGTIIGLIFMTNELGRVIQGAGSLETAELMTRIAGEDGPLDGLGIAFYTTLIGAILGGVILRILSNVVDANIMRYTAHIAELTEVNVLPFMRQLAKTLEATGYYQRLYQGG